GFTIYGSKEKYKGEDEVVRDTVSVSNETDLVIELEYAVNIDATSTTEGSIRGESIEIISTYILSDLVEGALDDEVQITTNKSLGDEITYVHVTSLRQLIQYMSAGITNHSITMTPGTYSVTEENIYDYAQVQYVTTTADAVLLLVAGNYNYYDLSGVVIEISTAVPPAIRHYTDGGFSNSEFHALHVTGRGNTVKGLTLIDVGSVYDDIGGSGYQNVVMDGAENVFEDIYTFSQGSTPYGYGELFGKGSPTVISHNKHSAWLIRGDYNVMRGCTVVHHAFGHFIFTQGGWCPTVENCCVYGQMSNTDTVLAEQGTGSSADLVDFMTYFGFFLTDIGKAGNNYAVGLGEGGVREYASGNTIIDGVCWGSGSTDDSDDDSTGGESSTDSSYRFGQTASSGGCSTGGNITVRNILLYQTRGNISFVLGSGDTYISDITTIGNQGGFGLKSASGSKGNNDNRRLRGTVDYGPVMSYAYGASDGSTNRTIYCEIEVIPSTVETRVANNGSGNAIHMKCYGNEIKLTAPTYQYDDKPGIPHPIFGNQLVAAIGGLDQVIGQFDETIDEEAYDCTLHNYTEFPVQISPLSHGNTVKQYGDNVVLIYGGTNTQSVSCSEIATATGIPAALGESVKTVTYNSKIAKGNTVNVEGDGDVYIYGSGNTVTVTGSGTVYVLGDNNTITASNPSNVKLASKITNHTYAKYPYKNGTYPGYAATSGYVGTLTFSPSGNTVNGSSLSGTAVEYTGGDEYKY
ncbi:MAG: hypothetical protein SNG27_08675, partial [Rikenellaceae bacterium]